MKTNEKLIAKPNEYAIDAISAIEAQLKTAKGSNRKTKLNLRLDKWKKFLDVLTTIDEENSNVKAVEESVQETES